MDPFMDGSPPDSGAMHDARHAIGPFERPRICAGGVAYAKLPS
jgi:hypothetical protein